MDHKGQPQKYGKTVFWLFMLVMLAKFNIYIGFALKPYMVFCILFFIVHIGSFYFQRLHLFEAAMLLFYLMYSFTGAFALYPGSSARIILGILLYICCYLIMRYIIGKTNDVSIKNAIANVGILFNSASLILYVIGLKSVSFVFDGDRISQYGVMVDRNYPRLIGLLQDPNFFVFYNTLFFCYYLSNFEWKKNKIGLMLCILTNILTFSRGGLLVILFLFIINLFLTNSFNKLKMIVSLSFSFLVVGYVAIYVMKFDFISILQSRLDDTSEDGGSGRLTLWGRAWDYFNSDILVGIGAFNFSDYNLFENGDPLTAHNTYLDILAESGLVGFISYSLFILLVFIKIIQMNIHRKNPYLFLTFLGFVLQMGFLSVIINDIFFLYLAILSAYLHHLYANERDRVNHHSFKAQRADATGHLSKEGVAFYERITVNR
jgi:O-antigen ligase